MNYLKFQEDINNLNLLVNLTCEYGKDDCIQVTTFEGKVVAEVYYHIKYQINTAFPDFDKLGSEIRDKLFELCVELSRVEPKDRLFIKQGGR